MRDKFPKSVRLKTYLGSLILVSVILVSLIAYTYSAGSFSRSVYLDNLPSSASYVVEADGSGNFWATRYDGKVLWYGTNDDLVIQGAINNSTSVGGTVFVKAGTYSASVTLKNKVRLEIDKGATGITVSANAGATCQLWDYNAGRIRYWKAGVCTTDIDMDSGTFWLDSWNSTIFQVVENNPNLSWKELWNATVEAIVEAYGYDEWNDAWNSTVEDLIFENLIWQGSWNATVIDLIHDNEDLTWQSAWNTTVQAIMDAYDLEWKDSWNATVEDLIFENLIWQGSWNSTVIDLIQKNQDFTWQDVWNATVEAIIDTYNIDEWRDSWSSTVTDLIESYFSNYGFVGPYSFIVDKSGSTYRAWYGANSTLAYSSTNASTVIQSAINALTNGGKIFIKTATYDIGTSTMQIPTAPTKRVIIISGEGYKNTKIIGSGAIMFDYLGTSFTNAPQVFLEHVEFDHNTNLENPITIDGGYIDGLTLNNVWLQKGGTLRTGTGVKVYPNWLSYNPTWQFVTAQDYSVGFDLGYDHLVGIGLVASKCLTGFYIHNISPSTAVYHVMLINPHCYNADMEGLNPIYYRFEKVNSGFLIQPTAEANGVSTGGTVFWHDGGGGPIFIERFESIDCVDTRGGGSGYPSKFDFLNENWKDFIFDIALLDGKTNEWIARIPTGIRHYDDKLYIRKLSVTLQNAPGTGKNVTFEVTDGTNSMTLTIAGTSVSGTTATGAFIWDTNTGTGTSSLIIRYNSTSNLTTGRATVVVSYTDITYW